MPGRGKAVATGTRLRKKVVELVRRLGLDAREEVKVGRRLWGSQRHIDVVATDPDTRRSIGLECKYQSKRGTAEEKIPALVSDIEAWPIRGLVVFDGPGFSPNMVNYLDSTGVAVRFKELEDWLKLFFGLEPSVRPHRKKERRPPKDASLW